MNKQTKIFWIDSAKKISGTTTNFDYSISNLLPNNSKNITVQLLKFIIPHNGKGINSSFIKIYCDGINPLNNSSQSFSNQLLLGILNCSSPLMIYNGINVNTDYNLNNECDQITNPQIKYKISEINNTFINIILLDNNNISPNLIGSGIDLVNSLICLEFEYEI